jgi:branched-chain amino acid transport system substrate-binding protein
MSRSRVSSVAVSGAILCSVTLAVAACASSGGNSSGGSGSASSPIVIGNQADLTGNATVGVPGNYGVQFAVQQINAHGGIDGHQIKLVTEDSQGSATGGTLSVRKLLDVDHVQAIINTSTSDASVPSIPAVQAASIPYLISAGTDPVLVQPSNTMVFITPAVSLTYASKAYVQYFAKAGYKKVAVIAAQDALGTENEKLMKQYAPQYGVTLSAWENFAATDTDFSAQVHSAAASNPDAIFVIGDFTGNVAKAVRDAGINLPLMYDAATTDPLLIKSLGSEAEGVVSFQTQATQLIDATTGPMATWKSEFAKAFPSPPAGVPSQFSLEGYQTTFVLAEAIKTALAKGPLTTAAIVSALQSMKGFVLGKTDFTYAVPIGYPVTFSQTDHAGDETVTPVVVKGGIFVPVS